MPGKFHFALEKPELLNKTAYLQAVRETRKLKAPNDLYIAYGPEDMGVAMVLRVNQRQEWKLVLPTDPNKYELECGLTYGITSRREMWDYVKHVLVGICRSSPGAFALSYEDADLGDVVEVGTFDPAKGALVISHRGLPSAADFETRAGSISKPTAPPVAARRHH